MTSIEKIAFVLSMVLCSCRAASADTLSVSASGQFASTVTADPLAAPNGIWSLSFEVSSSAAASNADELGFDAAITDFIYTLNGATLAFAPDEIRFATSSDLGLFTVFFGPESGFLNGMPIPIFTLEGAQAFSGPTTAPSILAGSYPITDVTYSDAANYDDEGALGTVVIVPASGSSNPPPPPVVTAVPEPASAMLLVIALIAGFAVNRLSPRVHLPRKQIS